jgi:hypothetical protein
MGQLKERNNILIWGTMSSGSSALHNLLKEYDNIGYLPVEFDYFRAPGLVADQLSEAASRDFPNEIDKLTKNRNCLLKLFFNTFIWKLIVNYFPKKYLEIEYRSLFPGKIKIRIIRLLHYHLLRRLNDILKTGLSFNDKIQFSKMWIQNIDNLFSNRKEWILFDQPILTSTAPDIWEKVFNPFKLIIVYRDPKDQLADIIERRYLFNPYGAPYMTIAGDNLEAIYGRNRIGAIRFQVDAIKSRLKWIDNMEKELGSERLLLLDFEGLIIHYEDYKSKIEDFIGGIRDNHKFKNKYFDPVLSGGNIGIYRKHLKEEDLKELTELEEWYWKRRAKGSDLEEQIRAGRND